MVLLLTKRNTFSHQISFRVNETVKIFNRQTVKYYRQSVKPHRFQWLGIGNCVLLKQLFFHLWTLKPINQHANIIIEVQYNSYFLKLNKISKDFHRQSGSENVLHYITVSKIRKEGLSVCHQPDICLLRLTKSKSRGIYPEFFLAYSLLVIV